MSFQAFWWYFLCLFAIERSCKTFIQKIDDDETGTNTFYEGRHFHPANFRDQDFAFGALALVNISGFLFVFVFLASLFCFLSRPFTCLLASVTTITLSCLISYRLSLWRRSGF